MGRFELYPYSIGGEGTDQSGSAGGERMDQSGFAERLKTLRRRSGLSQEQLAERIDVSRQVVTKWENSEGIPKISNLIALADCFDVSVDELLGRDPLDNRRYQSEVAAEIRKLTAELKKLRMEVREI